MHGFQAICRDKKVQPHLDERTINQYHELMKFPTHCLAVLALTFSFASGQDFISDTAAVRLSYSNIPDRKIEGTTTEVGLSEWAVMSPIFYHKAESWSFGAGFRYESTNLDFSDASSFDEDQPSFDRPTFVF